MRLDQTRSLSEPEQRILSFLLATQVPGEAELRAQVPHVQVVGKCDCGCPTIDLEVPDSVRQAPVEGGRFPVEALVAPKVDEPNGEIILFLDAGRLSSLEYVSYLDNPPAEWPSFERLSLLILGDGLV
jgi:hypothetical protein